MEAISMSRNVLSKGMNTNIYPSKLPNDFCYDLLNAKVYSVDGNSFVINNINGTKEVFEITPGYSIIGLEEHNNILYIVSSNINNSIEIGSYPSPKQMVYNSVSSGYITYTIDPLLTGFENIYKPLPSLYNHSIGRVMGFRTKKFNFDNDEIIYPISKASNDNTVNLYLCDGENPNRVVNNCFNYEGIVNIDRCYNYDQTAPILTNAIEYSIDRITRQFLSISKPAYAKLNAVEEGGELPLGNLFVYMRYLDYEFNKTNFVPLLGPVLIANGDDIFSTSGNNPDGNINNSNKRMVIDINYIDMSYNFFEIALVWKTSNDRVALGTKSMLLTKRVPIINNSELGFTITGKEEMSELDDDEVITPALKETISTAQTSFDGRWYGANWKESDYDKDAMKELAKRCFIFPELKSKDELYDLNGESMKDYSLYDVDIKGPSEINKRYWYQSPEFVLDRIGNYRGEVYPYALVGTLNDGTKTDPFPITGYDFYNDSNALPTLTDAFLANDDNTNNGFVRFPQFGTGNSSSKIDNMDYILLAKANMTFFWNYLNDPLNKDKFNSISGFEIVRGDRFKNLLYHGISLDCAEYAFPTGGKYFFGTDRTREVDIIEDKLAQSFPCLDRYPRYQGGVWNVDSYGPRYAIPGIYETEDDYYIAYIDSRRSKNRKGLFSPDFLFSNIDKIKTNEGTYVYIPYSQYPQYTLNSQSEISGISYYDIDWPANGSVYVSRLDYQNSKLGRAAVNNYYIRGRKETVGYPAYLSPSYFYKEKFLYISPYDFVDQIWMNSFNDTTYPYDPDDYLMDAAYIKTISTNVYKGVYRGINNYSSIFGDGLLDNIDIGFRYDNLAGIEVKYANRDINSVKYIGIDYTGNLDSYLLDVWNDSSMMPILLYKEQNNESYYVNLVSRYYNNNVRQLFGIDYKKCSLFIDKDNNRTYDWNFNELKKNFDNLYCNGDCFISRFSFRQQYNSKIFDIYPDDDGNPESNSDGSHYNHGTLASIVLQSDVNTGVRSFDRIGFYPLWAEDWKEHDTSFNYNSVLCARFGGTAGIEGEDFIYDWGHSETLPFEVMSGIDEVYKNDEIRFETRVRYTDKTYENAYIDSWRSMYYLSKADYSIVDGAINILGKHGMSMIAVQDRAIIQLFPNEKAITQTNNSSGSEAVVGVGSILPSESKKMADYGSQHKGFHESTDYLSGFDFNRSIWWKSGISTSGNNTILGITPISSNVSKYIIDRKDSITLPKVILGHDYNENELFLTVKSREYKTYDSYVENGRTYIEVGNDLLNINGSITIFLVQYYFHFDVYDYYNNLIVIDEDLSQYFVDNKLTLFVDMGYTLQLHETLSGKENSFISRTGFSPDIYGSFKSILISNDRLYDGVGGKVHIHNDKLNRATFYGHNSWFNIGVVINGVQEGQTFNQIIFGSMTTVSDVIPFDFINYETEFQSTRHFPFYDEERFWVTPEYRENKWDFTIPECFAGTGAGYEADSNMRGIWMKTLFVYKGNSPKFVGDILTRNILSQS